MRPIKVWDVAVRLFHWAIVVLVCLAWGTQEFDHMDWHVRIGCTILTLLVFRILWGFLGSDTARFSRFLRSPARAFAHLRHIGRREADREIGHNAAGGWMVLLMLGLLLGQVGTGLFANEEPGESYSAHGPFALRIADELSRSLTAAHEILFDLLLLAVALHVGAVLAYALLKRQNLVRPMLTGFKRLPAGSPAPRLASPALAAVLLALAAAIAWGLSRLGD
jgi:cytochrome b